MNPLHVWRRSDGHVGWTRGKNPPADEGAFTFTLLLTTHDERRARDLLSRAKQGAET
jgi:hypothetical protein